MWKVAAPLLRLLRAGFCAGFVGAIPAPVPVIETLCLWGLRNCVVSLSDVEQRRQAGSREDLVDHRTDVIEREPAAQGLRLLVQDDQVAQRARRQEFDVPEV